MGMMTEGVLFTVHGGMIVNTLNNINYVNMSNLMMNGGSYTMDNLPGRFPGAFYGVEALGWSSTSLGIGIPRVADLRNGDDIDVNMQMLMLLP